MELIKDNGNTLVLSYTMDELFNLGYMVGGVVTAKEAREWRAE